MKPLQLFCVKNRVTGAIVRGGEKGLPLYFTNKMLAKAQRDSLGDDFKVSPGPDHRRWWAKDDQEEC